MSGIISNIDQALSAETVISGSTEYVFHIVKLCMGAVGSFEGLVGSTNPIPVNIVAGGGSGTTNLTQINTINIPSAGVAGTLPIGGVVAAGANVSAANFPVLVAGSDYDGTPKVQLVKVDSSGLLHSSVDNTVTVTQTTASNLKVDLSGTATNTSNINVAVNAALPAGTNVIGALSANQSTNTVQIGGTNIVTAGVNGLQAIGGNVASGVTDTANPVKIGAVYNATQPTVTTGQRVDAQSDNRGNLMTYLATKIDPTNDKINIGDGTNSISIVTSSGAVAENTATWLKTASAIYGLDTSASAGSQDVPLKVESTAQPNLRVTWYNTGNQMGTTTSPVVVGGAAAAGATAAGNPVQAGGVFNTSPATITTGQAGALQLDNVQNLLVKVNTALPTGANVIGALTANQSVNVAQVAGTNTVTAGVNGLQAVGGNVASAATDSGNPVKVGGIFNTTQPTVTNGQRVDLQTDNRGNMMVNLATKLDSTNDAVSAVIIPPASGTIFAGANNGTSTQSATDITGATGITANKVFTGFAAISASAANATAAATGTLIVTITWVPGTSGTAAQRVATVNLNIPAGIAATDGTGAQGTIVVPILLYVGTTTGKFQATVTTTGTVSAFLWDVMISGNAQ